MAVTQHCYRWGNNNAIASRTWKAALNTSISSVTTSDILRLRFHIYSGSLDYVPTSQANWTLYVSTSVSGTYYAISDSENTLGWQFTNGATDADGTDISESGDGWISTGQAPDNDEGGSQYCEDGGDAKAIQSLGHADIPNVGGETDIEYAIIGSGASGAQAYYFRVRQSTSVLSSYTQTAQATMEGVPAFEQYSFRIGKDTSIASRTGDTNWLAAKNTNYILNTATYEENLRVRFHIRNTGSAPSTSNFVLYFSKNGGAYEEAFTSSVIDATDGVIDNNGDSITTTYWLDNLADTDTTGKYDESIASVSMTLTNGHETELEFSLVLGFIISDGDYIDLRIRHGSTVFGTYTQTPRITWNDVTPIFSQTNYRWAEDSNFNGRATGEWLAALDTKPIIYPNSQPIRLRTHLKLEDSYYITENWSLYWSINQTTWYQVTNSSTTWRSDVNGVDNADGAPVFSGDWITSDGGYVDATGEYSELDTTLINTFLSDYGADLETEFEWCLRPVGAINEDVYYFRVKFGAETGVSDTYAQIETRFYDSTKDVSVGVTTERYLTKDVSIDLTTRQPTYKDAKVKLTINNPENLELCTYDSVNSRWTNGSVSGVSKRYIEYTSNIIRKEGINKLSELSFNLMTNDIDLYIEKGDIIALGTEFAWTGSPGSSDSLFNEHLLFEGVVTSVKKSIKVKVGSDYIQTYKVISLHVAHTLSSEYEQMMISTKKVVFGGEEIIATPYYNIRTLLESMTYYDREGNTVTVTNLPIYIRNCGTYLKHIEYTDKNKLEILLDLCSKSPNIFYCHNDGFYFEPQKPSLSTSYFNKESSTQNYRNINYDAGFEIKDQQDLVDNDWDSNAGRYIEDSWSAIYVRNHSTVSQNLNGMAMWYTDYNGYTNIDVDQATLAAKGMGTIYTVASNQYDVSVSGWQRNKSIWNLGISPNNNQCAILKPTVHSPGYYYTIGVGRPSTVFNPFIVYTNHATPDPKWIFRSGFSPSFYAIMNDQVRFFNPAYPPRMMINPDDTGEQEDGWILQGYNPTTGLSMLSTVGLTAAETKASDNILYSNPIWIFNRDYTLLTGLSNAGNLASNIDDDNRLIGWHDTIQSFGVEVEMVDLALDTSSRTGVILNLDFAGNGIEDYIRCIVYYTGSSIAMKHSGYMNGVEQSTRTHYKTITTEVFTKLRLLYNFDGVSITNTKFQIWDSVAESWYEESVGWFGHHLNVVESGNGIGIVVENTYKEQGIKNVHVYAINEYNKTIDLDLASNVAITEPNIKGQYIVIGEKSDTIIRVPIGKYPVTPDTDGNIKVITKKVENNTAATAMARQLYEKDNQKTISFTYHEGYLDDTTTHSQIKPNKMISFDSDDYFVYSFDTTFMDNGCTSKIKAGYDPKNYFIMVYEKTEESTQEQANISAPIEVVYETEDLGGDDLMDATPVSFPSNYFTRTDF